MCKLFQSLFIDIKHLAILFPLQQDWDERTFEEPRTRVGSLDARLFWMTWPKMDFCSGPWPCPSVDPHPLIELTPDLFCLILPAVERLRLILCTWPCSDHVWHRLQVLITWVSYEEKPLCAPEAVCVIRTSGDRDWGAMLGEGRGLLEKTPELGEGQIFIYGG